MGPVATEPALADTTAGPVSPATTAASGDQPIGPGNRTWLPWATPDAAADVGGDTLEVDGAATDPRECSGAVDADLGSWTVRSGDHFWNIAERVVRHRGDGTTTPSDQEIARYWSRLVSANRDRLVEPGNADLLHPGQELVLPE